MKRKNFLRLSAASALGLLATQARVETQAGDPPFETYRFADDGHIPNSRYPLLLYRQAFAARGPAGAAWLEQHFAANNWTNSWRNGVYPFHHYHSTSHEVLGVYAGAAQLQLGGAQGQAVAVRAGDILVIPAGVGHKKLSAAPDFGVVGAYPDGRTWDVLRGQPGERPQADRTIAALPRPGADPLLGPGAGLVQQWA
ncbi:MAG: cupin [Janthinobacterium lividum]